MISVRNDQAEYGDSSADVAMATMRKFEILDDRIARTRRIEKFSAISPKMADIPRGAEVSTVLLPDDEIIATFRCDGIEGIPGPYFGAHGPRAIATRAVNKLESLIVVSFIKNASTGRIRFHITASDANLMLDVREHYSEVITGATAQCCGNNSLDANAEGVMGIHYKRTTEYVSRDLMIPLPPNSFSNCVVVRKSDGYAEMSAVKRFSASEAANANIEHRLNTCLDLYDERCNGILCCCNAVYCCGFASPCIRGFKSCIMGMDCIYATYNACGDCNNLLYSNFLCCKFNTPCVDDKRCCYPCCSKRCLAKINQSVCCLQEVNYTSQKSLDFAATEHFKLGTPDANPHVKEHFSAQPKDASEFGIVTSHTHTHTHTRTHTHAHTNQSLNLFFCFHQRQLD